MKMIEIKIDAEGNISEESKGFTGKSCNEVQEVMARIGIITGVTPTAEAHKKAEKPAYNELHRG
jgi:hypothetical protein